MNELALTLLHNMEENLAQELVHAQRNAIQDLVQVLSQQVICAETYLGFCQTTKREAKSLILAAKELIH